MIKKGLLVEAERQGRTTRLEIEPSLRKQLGISDNE